MKELTLMIIDLMKSELFIDERVETDFARISLRALCLRLFPSWQTLPILTMLSISTS